MVSEHIEKLTVQRAMQLKPAGHLFNKSNQFEDICKYSMTHLPIHVWYLDR